MHKNENIIPAKNIDSFSDDNELGIQLLNQHIATVFMQLKQEKKMVNTLKNDLLKLSRIDDLNILHKELGRLVRKLNFEENIEEEWNKLSVFFDKNQQVFLKKLDGIFPHLSHRDHKLCIYLRMKLTTKEIAPMLNISVRGVEISRYRLRKKLGLHNKENLAEFLSNI